uniref:Uncharacterized protein n=1 Tax=Zea mays TaxID=4577 RepID=A0A804NW04_MAIZE
MLSLCRHHWASLSDDSWRRRTSGQVAAVVGDAAPPLRPVDVEVTQRDEGEDAHERDAGVESGGEHVVVSHPPGLVAAVHDVVEDESEEPPHDEVHAARGEQPAGASEDERQVDAGEHAVGRVRTLEQPHGQRRQQADEEQVVHLPVVTEAAEHPQRADDAPDDGGVVEDVVAGARPGAAGGEPAHVADVLDRGEQPPRGGEVHRGRRERSGELREEHGPRGYLHVVAQLQVGQERQRLAHADEAVRLEHHVGQRLPRVEVADDELGDDVEPRLHVGGGEDDTDGEGEGEGDGAGKEEAPVGELQLLAEALAGEEREREHDGEHEVEPPLRHGLVVPPHDPRVHVVDICLLVLPLPAEAVPDLPSVVERDVRERGHEAGEADAVVDSEEHADVDAAVGVVADEVEREGVAVEDAASVVGPSGVVVDVRRDEREAPGVVGVRPVEQRQRDVGGEREPGHDVDDGERRRHQRVAEEAGHRVPVQAEGADAEAPQARPDLLRRHRVPVQPAQHRHGAQRREQVARDEVVGEAADDDDDEELETRHTAPGTLLLLVHGSSTYRDFSY